MKMKSFDFKMSVKVSQNWIDDGFDLNTPEWKEAIVEAFKAMLPYAFDEEMEVGITFSATQEAEENTLPDSIKEALNSGDGTYRP